MMATDYTDGLALKSIKTIFEYLPRAYDNGPNDIEAREKMANAATMQVWLSQTPSSAYATPWLISSALFIICLTALQTHL